MLRAAVFLSIAGVIQHSKQTFLLCNDGYIDCDIWMSPVIIVDYRKGEESVRESWKILLAVC